jgi:hypothetical protein
MVARRMSRIVKMGVCAALKCLKEADIAVPDAIITGTGLGCLEDTEKFLSSIYANDERLLNPTPFIQSTHNTVAGAIALAIKCNNYNSTYTHRGFSFESALTDAFLQLSENPALHILAGGFDELTETSYDITRRLGLWRRSQPGEGVAFFMLSGEEHSQNMGMITHMTTFFRPDAGTIPSEQVMQFIREAKISTEEIDLIISGDSTALSDIFPSKPSIPFKQFCGEYDTASSFALYLATLIVKGYRFKAGEAEVPRVVNRVLVYNPLRGTDHSLFLVERC